MREYFWKVIHELMKEDERIVILMSDTGFKVLDDIREEFGDRRCFDVGIAEQNMISVAAGMASEGLRPICYAIVPFVTNRCLEQIRDDICTKSLDVKLVGIGAGFDYHMLGSTHHSEGDIATMRALPNMMIYQPSDKESTKILAERMMGSARPCYFRLSRYGQESLYRKRREFCGFQLVPGSGGNPVIISSGVVLEEVLKAVEIVRKNTDPKMSCSVLDVGCLKGYDLDTVALLGAVSGSDRVFTVEEHTHVGGLADLVNSVIEERPPLERPMVTRIGIPDTFLPKYGSREYLLRESGLHAESIAERILEKYPNRRRKHGIEVYGRTNQSRSREDHVVIGRTEPDYIEKCGLGYLYIVQGGKLNGVRFNSVDGVRHVIGELELMVENAEKVENP